ncbi:MAG TPA: FGGY family carbohydrate kinase, partial [Treponemataceae bacterium]|nr:FGGY family carbohydrate kinase [Treponemataceae bacterium]
MKTVAGIDMGTQSMKVILYDYESKKIVASAQEAIDLIAENDGTREQKVEWYDEALKKCLSSFST